jgi:hypothetical protein
LKLWRHSVNPCLYFPCWVLAHSWLCSLLYGLKEGVWCYILIIFATVSILHLCFAFLCWYNYVLISYLKFAASILTFQYLSISFCSCVPLYNFSYIYTYLMASPKSFVLIICSISIISSQMYPIHVAVSLTRQRSVIIKTCLLPFRRINGGKDLRLFVSQLSCSYRYFNTYWGPYSESIDLLISVGSINQKACRSCCWWQKCITSIQKTLQGMLLFFSCRHQNVFLA